MRWPSLIAGQVPHPQVTAARKQSPDAALRVVQDVQVTERRGRVRRWRVAGHAGGQVRWGAEAPRSAAEFGLGRHVKVWRRGWSRAAAMVLGLGFLVGLPAVTAALALTASRSTES